MVTISEFIKAKAGVEDINVSIEVNGVWQSTPLSEFLHEYSQIISGEDVVQARNPRSGNYTLVNKDRGLIIGHYPNEFKNVPTAKSKKA